MEGQLASQGCAHPKSPSTGNSREAGISEVCVRSSHSTIPHPHPSPFPPPDHLKRGKKGSLQSCHPIPSHTQTGRLTDRIVGRTGNSHVSLAVCHADQSQFSRPADPLETGKHSRSRCPPALEHECWQPMLLLLKLVPWPNEKTHSTHRTTNTHTTTHTIRLSQFVACCRPKGARSSLCNIPGRTLLLIIRTLQFTVWTA